MNRLIAYLTRPTRHRIQISCDRPELWNITGGYCTCAKEKK